MSAAASCKESAELSGCTRRNLTAVSRTASPASISCQAAASCVRRLNAFAEPGPVRSPRRIPFPYPRHEHRRIFAGESLHSFHCRLGDNQRNERRGVPKPHRPCRGSSSNARDPGARFLRGQAARDGRRCPSRMMPSPVRAGRRDGPGPQSEQASLLLMPSIT